MHIHTNIHRTDIKNEEKNLKFKYEPQKTMGEIDITKPKSMSAESLRELIEDFCQGL